MAKICWKCGQKIGLIEKYNQFLEHSMDPKKKKIQLHNNCYLNLTEDEMKKISYNTKYGPPGGLRKNLKLEGFLMGGIMGGFGYSEGAFSMSMWMMKKLLKKKGMTFEELDDYCIDKYGYHYSILPDKLQNDIYGQLHKGELK